MGEIIIIVGLPGSGKTYLANKEYVPRGYILIDDPSSETFDVGKPQLDKAKNYVICDPHLCSSSAREMAILIFEKLGFEVKYIYFENNVNKAYSNIKNRNDKRKVSINTIKWFSENYTIPNRVKQLKIWENK